MKKQGCISVFIFYLNSLVAFLLLLSFILPYLPPSKFPSISVLSLAVAPLILVNIGFVLYWIMLFRKQFLLSLSVLILTTINFASFIKFGKTPLTVVDDNTIRIASHNVRLFNQYETKEKREETPGIFEEYLNEIQPDILFIQEFYDNKRINFQDLTHKYIAYNDSKNIFGHAIYSRFPIIDAGSFDFEQSSNNALWADIQINNDTVRVYNVHLQSMRITASVAYLQETGADVIKNKISDAFVKQENQLKKLQAHFQEAPTRKKIIGGDFNNTPFSYTYKKLQEGMNDAFLKKGRGLGSTFYFDGFPLRIDYLLVSPEIEVKQFTTKEDTFSDHYPVWADVKL